MAQRFHSCISCLPLIVRSSQRKNRIDVVRKRLLNQGSLLFILRSRIPSTQQTRLEGEKKRESIFRFMTLHGVRILQEICGTTSVHDTVVSSTAGAASSANDTSTASASVRLTLRAQSRLHQQPEFNITAPKPVTLREMIFRNSVRIVKPLGREDQLNSNKGTKAVPSSSSLSWAVKAEPTRAELLEELARRVAAGEEVADVVQRIKKLPAPKKTA